MTTHIERTNDNTHMTTHRDQHREGNTHKTTQHREDNTHKTTNTGQHPENSAQRAPLDSHHKERVGIVQRTTHKGQHTKDNTHMTTYT